MATATLDVQAWSEKGTRLLVRARDTLSNAPSEKVRGLVERVPKTILPEGDIIELVFAGQYSAGKSTVLSALTGRDDIKVGAGITTEETSVYDWNGVKVVDTPGVHTQKRPDHDEIAYRAISDADLIVFVITSELFDSHMATHFRKLAIERDKGHEMMLLVNKMRRGSSGNSPEAQRVIREDLRKVLAPFTPEELHICFVDALTALDSKTEQDPAVSQAFWRKSGFEAFLKQLDDFVKEKGLASRYTTALYSLEELLQESLAAESSGDTDVDALEELLLQRRRALVDTQQRILRAVESEVHRKSAQVRQEGRQVAELIHGKANPKQVDLELQAAQQRVQAHAEELERSVGAIIGEHLQALEARVGRIADSELAKELLRRLAIRLADISCSPDAMAKFKTASDVSRRLGEFLVKNSFNPKAGTLAGLFKLNQYSGTATHGAVKAVGKFFGKTFKPWEAAKWTRGIANAGRVLTVVGTVLTFALQIKEDADAAQLERDLRESRSTVRNGFNDAAHAIDQHFEQATESCIAHTLMSDIKAVDDQLADLRAMQKSRGQLFVDLAALLDQTRDLIRDLHGKVPEALPL